MSRLIIAVTGASAQILAERSIDLLLQANQKIDVILSKGSYQVWQSENNINNHPLHYLHNHIPFEN